MPNGIVEDRFNSYCFSGKAFWSRVLGTSQEGSHPRVGARCYLLNKLVFDRSNSENLFCIVKKISRHIMKYFGMFNKVGTPCALFFHKKNQILAFGGLGELVKSSLATEKPSFRQLKGLIQEYINHQKLIDSIF